MVRRIVLGMLVTVQGDDDTVYKVRSRSYGPDDDEKGRVELSDPFTAPGMVATGAWMYDLQPVRRAYLVGKLRTHLNKAQALAKGDIVEQGELADNLRLANIYAEGLPYAPQ